MGRDLTGSDSCPPPYTGVFGSALYFVAAV
jgi:hypothetical protein